MRQEEKKYQFSYNFILSFLLALFLSYFITASGVLLLAFLLLTFHIPIAFTDMIMYGIYWISVFLGVICLQKMKADKFRFQGILLAFFYCGIFLILGRISNTGFQLWEQEHGLLLLTSGLVGEIAELFVNKR